MIGYFPNIMLLTTEENEFQFLTMYITPPTAYINNANCTKSLTMSIKQEKDENMCNGTNAVGDLNL